MNSRPFLKIYKSKSHSDIADTLQYCQQFSAISRNLILKWNLNTFTKSWWFIQELTTYLKNEMFVWYELDLDNVVNIDFDDLFKKTVRLLIAKKMLANLVHVEKESEKVEDLVIKYDYKSRISSNPSSFVIPLLTSAYHPSYFPSPLSVQTNGTNYRPVDKKIHHLTEMMNSLVLSVRTLQNNIGSSPNENIRPRLPSTTLINTF